MKKVHPIIQKIHLCLKQDKTQAEIIKELNEIHIPALKLVHDAEVAAVKYYPEDDRPEITCDINAIVNGETALALACSLGLADCIEPLLASGAMPNELNQRGSSPLGIAIAKGHDQCVYNLFHYENYENYKPSVDANAYTSSRTGISYNPLQVATQLGNFNIVKFLVEKGADVTIINGNQETLLHIAAKSNKENSNKCLAYLLDQGLLNTVNSQDKNGDTALHFACNLGSKEKTEMLMSIDGINTTLENMQQVTALFHAANQGHYQCIQEMFKKIDAQTAEQLVNKPGHITEHTKLGKQIVIRTPLSTARQLNKDKSKHNDCIQTMLYLLLAGARVDAGKAEEKFKERDKLAQSGYKKDLKNALLREAENHAQSRGYDTAISLLQSTLDRESAFTKIFNHVVNEGFAGLFSPKKPATGKPAEIKEIEAKIAEYRQLKQQAAAAPAAACNPGQQAYDQLYEPQQPQEAYEAAPGGYLGNGDAGYGDYQHKAAKPQFMAQPPEDIRPPASGAAVDLFAEPPQVFRDQKPAGSFN